MDNINNSERKVVLQSTISKWKNTCIETTAKTKYKSHKLNNNNNYRSYENHKKDHNNKTNKNEDSIFKIHTINHLFNENVVEKTESATKTLNLQNYFLCSIKTKQKYIVPENNHSIASGFLIKLNFHIFKKKNVYWDFFRKFYSTSSPGENQVEGLPPALVLY